MVEIHISTGVHLWGPQIKLGWNTVTLPHSQIVHGHGYATTAELSSYERWGDPQSLQYQAIHLSDPLQKQFTIPWSKQNLPTAL